MNRCGATIAVFDENVVDTKQCEAEADHNGLHWVKHEACLPEALLCWRREIPVEEHA